MQTISKTLLFTLLLSFSAIAQPGTFQDALLDRLIGTWVLRGAIEGKETTHDITAAWVLGHQYVQITESSREKNASGGAEYEAIVYIGWDQSLKQYACLWLDVTGGGGLTGQAIGHGQRNGDSIPFLFKSGGDSVFRNTFSYDKDADAWQWLMVGEEKGNEQPFAKVRLTRGK